jgi:hypothetical protein
MARFSIRRLHFGKTQEAETDDNGEGLPTPARIKLAKRRQAGIAEANGILEHMPGPGESLHCIITARMDLTDIILTMGERAAVPIDRLCIATLGFNDRNLQSMLNWLDAGAVKQLTLLASIFFRSHKGDLWQETLKQFRQRGQRAACCHSHAKVAAMAFANGDRFSIEGSANLCGNGSGREQIAIINDAGLHDWHAAWINDLVTRHEGEQPKPPRKRRARSPAPAA